MELNRGVTVSMDETEKASLLCKCSASHILHLTDLTSHSGLGAENAAFAMTTFVTPAHEQQRLPRVPHVPAE